MLVCHMLHTGGGTPPLIENYRTALQSVIISSDRLLYMLPIMSFCFNFDLHAQTKDRDEVVNAGNPDLSDKHTEENTKTSQVKEAMEHVLPTDLQFLFEDAVPETVTIGTLPPLHFLNETVFEKTALEREDGENILSFANGQRSDLIPGVYEGGLRVWECTYDLLELVERNGEVFGEKNVLDLGCGAGLLGILALKRGAKQVHFQDYNSTVIKQLTLPNVLLNCQEENGESEDDYDEGDEHKESAAKDKQEVIDYEPPLKKRTIESSLHGLPDRCRFFSGDWTMFLSLVLKEEPSPKYDIIFTSETIYNTAYYPALHETLHRLLAPDGMVYLATKSHYFGVGGGLHLFEKFVEQRDIFSLDHLWHGEEGLKRHVVSLSFKMAS